MSYLVEWLEPATAGLERIYLFLAEKDEEAARAAIKAIRAKPFYWKITQTQDDQQKTLNRSSENY